MNKILFERARLVAVQGGILDPTQKIVHPDCPLFGQLQCGNNELMRLSGTLTDRCVDMVIEKFSMKSCNSLPILTAMLWVPFSVTPDFSEFTALKKLGEVVAATGVKMFNYALGELLKDNSIIPIDANVATGYVVHLDHHQPHGIHVHVYVFPFYFEEGRLTSFELTGATASFRDLIEQKGHYCLGGSVLYYNGKTASLIEAGFDISRRIGLEDIQTN